MANTLITYSAKGVLITVDGIPLEGIGPDTFVSIEVPEAWTSASSGDGKLVARAETNEAMTSLTITLAQGSASNQTLTNLYNLDKTTEGGRVFSILITDTNGGDEFFAEKAWISKPANLDFGKETGTREWSLQAAFFTYNVGGGTAR